MAVKTENMRKVSRISSARTRQKFVNWGLNILTWVMIFIILIPIIFMVVGSFKSRGEFTSPISPIFPEVWHIENYATMWNQIKFGDLFANSIVVTGFTTLIATFFAALGGYALARFRFPGADTFGLMVLGTQLIPGTLFFIPLYLMFLWIKNNLGIPMVGSNFGAIILYVGFFTPISLWILRGFFASIPPDLEEQAMVDGTTRFGAFWRISLPLAGPGITSTAIYIFMTAWNELFFGYTLGVVTVPVGIRQFVFGASGTQLRYDLMAAASVVITIPLAIMFLVLQKQFIQGLTAGAVK
ncbi:MAG TPA: carbohydrate ABC transporter permease [Anaerolineaceae bacterium]|nr:carbohydrate ABC transporter permease [Anaerolineaceae bacterium]